MKTEYQKKKIELIQWLSTLEDPAMIDELLSIRKNEKVDWWNQISANEKRSIQEGLQQAEEGRLKTHSDVKKTYEKWL